jgi:tetratricopeptide (TPR) repeat protein
MMFGLNDQNVRGVATVARTIRESDFARLPQIHYVASPVPNLTREKKGPLVQRWSVATHQIGTKIKSSIRYHHIAALNERLFTLDPDLESSPLVSDYHKLLESLIDYNRSGLDFLLKQTREAISKINNELNTRLFSVLEQEFPDRADSLLARAQLKKALGDPDAAVALACQALDADPAYEEAFEWLLDNYRRNGNYGAALALCDAALLRLENLPPQRRYKLHSDRDQIAMAAGNYTAAMESSAACISHLAERKKKGDLDPELLLINLFNNCEAARRHTAKLDLECWCSVISLFRATGEGSAQPLNSQANHWQAMHIAFSMTGDITRAREALTKARHAAEFLGLAEDIFTVKNYTDVPVQEFLKINDEMLAALDKGQLWDGMPLPTTKLEPAPPAAPDPAAT